MRLLIVSAANDKVERFVIDHWFASLRDSIDLREIDIALIDYGFTDQARLRLASEGVRLIDGDVHGHVVNARFLDLAAYLERHDYDRVLFCDSGDLIFQRDISEYLRSVASDRFTAMRDPVVVNNQIFGMGDVPPRQLVRLLRTYASVPMVNAGVIMGPPASFVSFARFLEASTRSLRSYGTDQLLFSMFVEEHGLCELDRAYNWIPLYFTDFTVEGGVVLHDGEPIPIVHNAGWLDGLRAFKRFGYGPDRNVFRSRFVKVISRTYRQSKRR
jgi:hypothetical protein